MKSSRYIPQTETDPEETMASLRKLLRESHARERKMRESLISIKNSAHTWANVILTADDEIESKEKIRKFFGSKFRDIQKMAEGHDNA